MGDPWQQEGGSMARSDEDRAKLRAEIQQVTRELKSLQRELYGNSTPPPVDSWTPEERELAEKLRQLVIKALAEDE